MGVHQETPTTIVSHLSAAALDELKSLLLEERVAHAARQERLSPDGPGAAELDAARLEVELARTAEAINEIDEALARIEMGTYGHCGSCSTAIPFERLEAVPRTRLCVECQARSTSVLG